MNFVPANTGKADPFPSKLFLNDATESEVSFPSSYDDLKTPTNENIHILDSSNMTNNNFVLYKNINMNHMDRPPPSYDQITWCEKVQEKRWNIDLCFFLLSAVELEEAKML